MCSKNNTYMKLYKASVFDTGNGVRLNYKTKHMCNIEFKKTK